ncbi:hypothetical protein QYE76_058395 [Lolium multiflorum]|uniref:Uncharacterized protein n=1 Tax=Lolium multiflorum TaxID=4521 RepID=A0AAD8T6T4_LOLMU|nr:hypothetical protein QYE76_058395 [Lolium multiflorum]
MAKKANKKDINSIREELQRKGDEKDISSIREELQRLQMSNALLSRYLIDIQEQRSQQRQQHQVVAIQDLETSSPSPSPQHRHELEGETGRAGDGYWPGTWAQGGGYKRN